MNKTARGLWESFAVVLPADAGPTQRQEMRRAFYGGMWAALCLFRGIGDDSVSEEEGVKILADLTAECVRFKNDVLAGRA